MTVFSSPIPLPHIPDNLSIPQFFLRAFPQPRPARPSHVPYFIEDGSGRQVTYEEVHSRTHALANGLSLRCDFKERDVACLFSPNHIDYAVAVWAVHTLGGTITPANPSLTDEELKYQLTTTRAKVIIAYPNCLVAALSAARAIGLAKDRIVLLGDAHDPHSSSEGFFTLGELITWGSSKPENFRALRFEPGEARRRLAFLSFSSGTTGKPKAVAISHFAVIANVIQMAEHYHLNDPLWPQKRMSPGDIALGVLPFFHIYGLIVTLHYLLYCGMTVVVVPKFNFVDFLRSINRHKVSHLYLVPPQIVLLCKHPAVKGLDFSHVKFCMSGAAPLSGDLMTQVRNLFPNAVIGQGYGLTETAATVCFLQPERKFGTIGSAGQLIPGIFAKVIKSDGSLACEGGQGELVVTGPSMALGYFENPTATAETFVDGWVRTGDEVIIRNNEIFVVDRLKEIMKVKGYQVAPAELEGHLLLHPDVVDACVVGVPDEYSGEVPLAFVVPSANALKHIKGDLAREEALKQSIKKHISDAKVHYKRLAGGVQFIDAIPKNPSGKILRRILREQARGLARNGAFSSKL